MSEKRWTKEQRDAIEKEGGNILVAAAAGSGKTSVLVERIISKITSRENPIDIDRFLVVTFTNAAASEMRERIGKALYGLLEKNPDSQILKKQIALLNKAHIMTIHSFCLNVIQNYFHHIELNPDFRITDDTENLLMKSEAIDEVINEIYEGDDDERQSFLELLDTYGSNLGDGSIKDLVIRVYDFIRSTPRPFDWLFEKTRMFNVEDVEKTDFLDTTWGKILVERSLMAAKNLVVKNEGALRLISDNDEFKNYEGAFISDKEMLSELVCILSGGKSWDGIGAFLDQVEFRRLSPVRGVSDEALKDRLRAIRDEIKGEVVKMARDVFCLSSRDAFKEISAIYPQLRSIEELLVKFDEALNRKKTRMQVLDFNDLEHYCLKILLKVTGDGSVLYSHAAEELKDKYDEILIDEYQDSNLIQEEILRAVGRWDRGCPNIFMVGDVKQSIYRFRHANPGLFIDKYNTYSKDLNEQHVKIILNRNFRSRKNILTFINHIFSAIMSPHAGEIDYDGDEMLYLGADYENEDDPAYLPEIHIVESEMDEDGDDPFLDNIRLEARAVGQIIGNMMGKLTIYDGKTPRPLEYRDIVILSRSVSTISTKFSKELGDMGIPVFAPIEEGFYDSVEVITLLSILKIIDNPRQDIPLLGVLRAPFFGFTPDELTRIRLYDSLGCFYEVLIEVAARHDDDDLRTKAGEFLQRLDFWRKKAEYLPVDELIWFLYEDTGYFLFIGALAGGEQRQANLRKLFEQAGTYEQTSYRGLFNFINFVEKLKKSSIDIGEAKILGENENAIRLMSIHKSKGLEFPVVILVNCGKRFNLEDIRSNMLLNHREGFGPDYVDPGLRVVYASGAKQAMKVLMSNENLSEEMRILYVAMTRAREKLVITGTVKSHTDDFTRWTSEGGLGEGIMDPYEVIKGSRYLDWIMPAVLWDSTYGNMVRTIKRNELSYSWEKPPEKADPIEKTWDGEEYRGEVLRRLKWEYAHKDALEVPAKVTVTELKRLKSHGEDGWFPPKMLYLPKVNKVPGFLEEEMGLDQARAGSVIHYVMQNLDLRNVGSEGEIEGQVGEMVQREKISPLEKSCVDVKKIYRFFISEYGKRMLQSKRIQREVPFNILMDASELGETYGAEGEQVLLQGIIDLFFEEDDGIVLLDYKTDQYATEKRMIQMYSIQLKYYGQVLERLLKMRVKEKVIYMLNREKALLID